jgi:drug/metabolite transporter (DMT)-like permease
MTQIAARLAALPGEARGAAVLVLATALFASMDAVGKGLMQRHDPVQVVWARYAGQMLIVMLILNVRLPQAARTRRLGIQLLRSAMMFGATLSGFFAFASMPLAEATAIFEVAPLMITALAALVLGEKVGPRRWAGVFIGFLGALVIVRPGAAVFQPVALLPLVGALCFAVYAIATRFLGRDEGQMTTLLWSATLGTLAASVMVPFVWTTPTPQDAALMALTALLGVGGQFLMIVAFAAAPASAIAPFTYCGLVFAAVLGYAAFGDAPDAWTVAGAVMIVGSGLYVWHRERVRAQRGG